MSQAIHTLGTEAKRILETLDGETVTIDRKPPAQREHFLAINDLRITSELTGRLKFFYSASELPALGWNEALIPDGIASFDRTVVAWEFDRGVEGVQFFIRTKIPAYQRGFESIAIDAIVIVADREQRMRSLAKAIGSQGRRMVFTTLEKIQQHTLQSPIFYTEAVGWGVQLFEGLSSQSLSTTREFWPNNTLHISNLDFIEQGLLRQKE